MTRRIELQAALAEKYGIEILPELDQLIAQAVAELECSQAIDDLLMELRKRNRKPYQIRMDIIKYAKSTGQWIAFAQIGDDLFADIWAEINKDAKFVLSHTGGMFRWEG